QRPLDGVSFAHTFTDASAPSAHVTQYYEMFGSRALYHDGWKAVVFHPLPGIAYGGEDPFRPFDEDEWELYHVAAAFSAPAGLAARARGRLRQPIELGWQEAERNQGLPVTTRPGLHGDRRHRRDRYELRPGIGSLPAAVAPNVRNRSFRVLAEIDVPARRDGA